MSIDRYGDDRPSPFRFYRAVTITFPVANVSTEVQHRCGDIPDGVLTIRSGGLVKDVPGVQWTKDLAYLQSDTVGSATLLFVVLREEPLNVNP